MHPSLASVSTPQIALNFLVYKFDGDSCEETCTVCTVAITSMYADYAGITSIHT